LWSRERYFDFAPAILTLEGTPPGVAPEYSIGLLSGRM
jgi:hypothetical protein